MHPEEFTISDRRAYKALGAEEAFRPTVIDTYLEYLSFCRRRAIEIRISLRDYDRALRQYGAPNREPVSHVIAGPKFRRGRSLP
jgi:hypothetical protein